MGRRALAPFKEGINTFNLITREPPLAGKSFLGLREIDLVPHASVGGKDSRNGVGQDVRKSSRKRKNRTLLRGMLLLRLCREALALRG